MDPNRLKGKNILITGAARGMGAANAEAFAAQGANVCIGDLDQDEAQAVATRINEAGGGKAIAVIGYPSLPRIKPPISQFPIWAVSATIPLPRCKA